jgi:hypothetical protein
LSAINALNYITFLYKGDKGKIVRKGVMKIVRKGVIIFVVFVLLGSSQLTMGAGEPRVIGGRAAGMCGISVAATDPWSAANNQAANAWNKGILCGVYFEDRYLLKELSYKALVFSACTKQGVFSASCMQFGSEVYSELKSGISYARKFGKSFSAGIQLDYYRFSISEDYGSKNILNCELGLLFRPGKQVWIGFHCINPVPVKLSQTSGESLPTLIQLGLAYYFTEDLMLSAEIEKDPVSKACARIGGECRFAKILSARAGFATGPFRFSFGAGIVMKRFTVDIASEYSQALGFSPAVSIQYEFRK